MVSLSWINSDAESSIEHNLLLDNFCGTVFTSKNDFYGANVAGKNIYIAGDVSAALNHPHILEVAYILIIKNLVNPAQHLAKYTEKYTGLIHSALVPLNVNGAGVFVRQFFPENYFSEIVAPQDKKNIISTLFFIYARN